MKKKIVVKGIIAILLLSGVVFSGCVQEQKPSQKSPQDTAVELVTALSEKNYAQAYSFFNSSITEQLTLAQFQAAWESVLQSYGDFKGIVSTRTANVSGYEQVFVTCNFSTLGFLDINVVFDAQSRIVGFVFTETEQTYEYTPPAYVNLSAFTETNVTVGSGGWVLPGTLSVPTGSGPFPAVVLVQGSGPNDQDETIGPNKPFKDLAWGLASQGVVVLRYVKRTKQYPAEFAALQNFTVEDETVDDAIIAVSVLNGSSVVNHTQMFVLGHSLGGMLAPRIASQDDRIAGIIILAGNTRPLEDLILEQTWYLANLSGTNQSEQIAAVEALVQKIKTLNFTDDEFVLGAPKSYWEDLSAYDPVAIAQNLSIPMMILQGLRDYQVTMEDFARWNDTFSGNPNATLKTYPSLTHLFISGTGVPTNTEYLIAGHVAEEVINDIAAWIKEH